MSKNKKDNDVLSLITDIYIFLIIVLFPLMVDSSGFFKILEFKYNCFVYMSITYIFLIIILSIYYFLKGINILKRRKLMLAEWLAVIYLVINIISCLISPFFKSYNLFIGPGRMEGLLVTTLYVLSFLFVSYFGRFRKRYVLYFSLSSILLSLIAILQYVGLNPFNMYQDGIGIHNVSFMTTIGNIDFISAVYTILLSVSIGSYIFLNNNKYEKIIHLLSVLMGVLVLQIIDVSSGRLAFFLTIILILPFIFQTNKRLSRFLNIFNCILISNVINMMIGVEYHYDIGKLLFNPKFNCLTIIFMILIFILYLLAKYLNTINYDVRNNKKVIKNYYIFMIILGVISLIIIYIFPFKYGFLYELHELLHFNFDDNFGTYRIFLWKRTIPLIKDFPLLGSGPDTFALRFMPLYSDDIASIGPLTINDTAANIYLTNFINIGIIGGLSYIWFLLYQVYDGVKNRNEYSSIFLIAVICYMIQSFFNLSVVIVTPLFWVLMGIHFLSLNGILSDSLNIKKISGGNKNEK